MAIPESIKKLANDIRTKIYGKEVREALAKGIEEAGNIADETQTRQDELEGQFQTVLDETTGKDVISAPEIIAARVSTDGTNHNNLKERLDKEHQEVTSQLAHEAQQRQSEVERIDGLIKNNRNLWGNKSIHPLFYEGNGIERQVSIPKFKPVLYGDNPILENTTPNLVDGEFFFTIVHAEEVLDNPIDKFYGYAATHDGDSIWLATAPTPEGPWTWQKPVITVGIGNQYTGHVSSPNVLIHEDKFYMYYHGVYGDNVQPTSLAISSDGENFVTHEKFPLIPTGENRDMGFYGQSVSYFRVVKDGNLFIGVFQANNNLRNLQANNSVTVSIGYALSEDGINWRVGKKPLISNPIGERGYFGPGIIKLFGKWCLFFMNNTTESIYMAASDVLEPNSFEVLGEVIPKGTGDWNSKRVEFQDFLLYDNKLYIFFGGVRIDNNRGSLGVATFDWRNVE